MSDVDSTKEENPFTPSKDAAKIDTFLGRFKSPAQEEKPHLELVKNAMEDIDRQTSTDVLLTKLKKEQISQDDARKSLVATQQHLAERSRQAAESANAKEKALKTLEEKLTRDGLTGLRNKVWFEQELKNKIAEPKNNTSNSKLWLVYMDLDKFKDVNSAYGHQIGDKVIKLIAMVKKDQEELARVGGEEFALIVDLNEIESGDEDASDEAKLRTILERYSTTFKDLSENLLREAKPGDHLSDTPEVVPPRKISLSFGLSRYQIGDDPEILKERASSAVLRAKNTGRDRAIASFSTRNELLYADLKIPG